MLTNKFIKSLVQLTAVIGLAALLYLVDEFTVINKEINHAIILLIATLKTFYFLSHNFDRVKEISEGDDNFVVFMKLMSMNIALTVLSFATDYYSIYHIYPGSFIGLRETASVAFNFAEFIYFSVTTFSTTGLGDIFPNSLAAKYLVCLEVIIAFITIIFLVSNFAHLKEQTKNGKEV